MLTVKRYLRNRPATGSCPFGADDRRRNGVAIMQGTALGTLLSARSGWLQARYTVLAQNVANADTPHFVPQDLPEPDFDRLLADSARSAGTGSTSKSAAVPPGS